ncbi:putative ribonuclease H-like domain-containing protein [Tanacetum coccineum]|uniref:Ribonuclease H-like domain-containing protein n=1 Tax=Tanacetum coccineum TaxID=301880 RepID=A0ABQ4XFF4_9ASTR
MSLNYIREVSKFTQSLNNLLESQVINKFKNGLGYNVTSSTIASPAVESFVNSSEMLENQKNNKSKSDKGYRAVPLPFTGNFMPCKPDLTFMNKIVKIEPKTVRKNSFRPLVIEDLNSNDESEVEIIPQDKTVSSSTEKVKRPVWNNSRRVNHKNFANKMTHPHPNRRFVPQAILTRFGKINTAGASVNTAGVSVNTVVRQVKTAGSKPTVNHPRPISNAYKKGYSQVTRPFNKGVKRKFMFSRTPQQNGVAERRNRTLIEAARTIIHPIPITQPEPLISQDPKVGEEDAEEKPTKMDESGASYKHGKDDQATRSEFERLLQQEKHTENPNRCNSINTVSTPVSITGPSFTNDDPSSLVNAAEASNAFKEHLFERFSPFKNTFTLPPVSNVTLMDDARIFGNAYDDEDVGAEADLNKLETTLNVSPIPTTKIGKDHPKVQIIGDFKSAIQTRRMTKNFLMNMSWIEAIRLFLAYASFMGFIVYQMDVKSSSYMDTNKRGVQHKKDGIFISQDKYVAEVLKKFDFATVKTASTPMEPNKALIKDEEADSVDVHLYRSMIGSLIYLKGQPKLGLWYPKDSPFDLEAFSNSDYAGASLDRKSTTGRVLNILARGAMEFKNQMLDMNY